VGSSPAPVVHLKRLRAGAASPIYMSEGAAGMDLAAALDEPIRLAPRERRLVPTGWAMAIQPGFEGQVRPRSGLALKTGVTVLNAPGTIDADYRGEVMVLLVNTGDAEVVIEPGMRIAQLVIARVLRADVSEVSELPGTMRGEGGFGSTGRGG
jgi:dUTP pyrophosphatase